VDASLPSEPRRPVIGYELVISVQEEWPRVMGVKDVRLTPALHAQYLEKSDMDIAKEVVRIAQE